MGTLSKEFEQPAYWDQQRERRIFLQNEPREARGWGIYWMRGYCGLNKLNRFKSIPESHEKQFAEGHIRRLAKEKGWSEMARCPECGILFIPSSRLPGEKCFACIYRPDGDNNAS
jgi:hypothetical protein